MPIGMIQPANAAEARRASSSVVSDMGDAAQGDRTAAHAQEIATTRIRRSGR